MSFAPLFPTQPDPLRRWRNTARDRVALVDRTTDARLTYGELDARADRAAAALQSLGIRKGDRVGALSNNRLELIELFFACGRIGAALVPFNWRLAAAELGPIIAHAQVTVCFGEGAFRTLAEDATRAADVLLRWIDFDDEYPALLRARGAARDVDIDAEDPLLVLYTSGSTGTPKGAILPHRQIFYNAIATTTAWQLTHEDIAPITTPCFHTGGWNVFATPLWQRGGTVVLMEKFEPAEFLNAMREECCTVSLTVPTQLLMMLDAPNWGIELPHLRSFFSGGAPCPGVVLERVRSAGYRIREGYGLTECGPNCFTISPEQAIARPGVVGWPMPLLETKLVNEIGAEIGHGEIGELLLRGPQMFAGYLNAAERTAEAIAPGGWLRTGDLALRAEDGAYAIAGRRKEMYISGGENVFPAEVESVLALCPGLAEVAVIGVVDALWGEVGKAFVVRANGNNISEAIVIEYARERLAKYKVPKSVAFVEAIPRLGSGKVDRASLRALSA
ncbi:MAG: class I adenylate-forming enzyme family protein [Gemmatimonadota bacterium]